MSRAKRWVFTLNNPTPEEVVNLNNLGPQVEYLVFGNEVGENGTPHLQGYVHFKAAVRFTTAKNKLSPRVHLEVARGSPEEAATYCKKDGNFQEYGVLPEGQGKRRDLDAFFDWADEFAIEHGRPATTPEAAKAHPAIITKYPRVLPVARLRFESPSLVEGEPRQWQQDLHDELEGPADDRTVIFYVDPEGGKGKSWFIKWFYSNHRKEAQVLGVGKRDDIAHMVKESKSVFLINVPRGQMEYFQYSVLEMLKDRLVTSPKYNSMVKELHQTPHVVVFSNEAPDLSKMSMDRFVIREIDDSD